MVNLFINFVIFILLKLALTVVKDEFCNVNCVKYKGVWYYASFQYIYYFFTSKKSYLALQHSNIWELDS